MNGFHLNYFEGREDGFSLVELLVVLAVIALLGTVSLSARRINHPNKELEIVARQIASNLRHARSYALLQNDNVVVLIDVNEREIRFPALGTATLPADVMATFITANQRNASLASIVFFPDGSSTGGRITLHRGSHESEIAVDWLTGYTAVQKVGGVEP